MDCSKCGRANPEDARFCNGCGAALATPCSACRHVNPPDSRFCNACGKAFASLADSGSAEPQPAPALGGPALASSAPAAATDPSALGAGERRVATIVFSDLSGYTALNERLDPEDVAAIMSRVKAEAVRIVERHGGMVNQFIGDEVVALFGIPVAHEDDPVRAVRAAMGLHQAVRLLSGEVEPRIGTPLRIHTGINTGLIVTGARDARDGHFSLTGDTVNTGARLLSQAEADTILVSPETQRLIAAFYETEALPAVPLKGKAQPMVPHRVLDSLGARTRLEAEARKGLTPYTGREGELGILRDCLERAALGKGQVVVVTGETGTGKSRLAHEFRAGLASDQYTLLEGSCEAGGEHTPYLPLIDAFARRLQLDELDSIADLQAHVIARIRAISPALEPVLPLVLQLLSIPGAEHPIPPHLQGEALRRALEEAVSSVLFAQARKLPAVLILEDWQWSDDASDSALRRILQGVPAERVLVMLLSRPERSPSIEHHPYVTRITLGPLPPEQSRRLALGRLQVSELPDGLWERIHQDTGGNPLYVEEMCMALVDEGVVRIENGRATLSRPLQQVILPPAVHACIRARVDRLEPEAREVLSYSAVVGREIPARIVQELLAARLRVAEAWLSLEAANLLTCIQVQPERRYLFRNALTQLVVYETLLLQNRREVHRLVGQIIERTYPERIEEHVEVLTQHFQKAECWDKAAHYSIQAGLKAHRRYNLPLTRAHLTKARELVERHRPDLPWREVYDMHATLGFVFGDHAQWGHAADAHEAAAAAAKGRSRELEVRATMIAAQAALFGLDASRAQRILAALEQQESANPRIMVGVALGQGLALGLADNLPGVLDKMRSLDALLEQAPDSPFRFMAFAIHGMLIRWQGDAQRAEKMLAQVVPVAKALHFSDLYLRSSYQYALAIGEQGRFQDAYTALQEGLEYGAKAGERWNVPKLVNTLGWLYHELCQDDRALAQNLECLHLIRDMLGPGTSNLYEIESQARLDAAQNLIQRAEFDEAERHVAGVYAALEKPEYAFVRPRWRARCLLTIGELVLARGRLDDAARYLDESERDGWIEGFPFRKYRVRQERLRGALLAERGDLASASAALNQAFGLAQQLGNPSELWRTARALGHVLARRGEAAAARVQFRLALATVNKLAEGLTDSELKRGFLDSTPVRELMTLAAD